MLKNPEIEAVVSSADAREGKQRSSADESGYSEKKQAQAIESQFDYNQRKRNIPPLKGGGAKTHINKLSMYNEVSGKLAELMDQYVNLIEDDLHKAQKLLNQIHELEKQRKDLFEKLTFSTV